MVVLLGTCRTSNLSGINIKHFMTDERVVPAMRCK